MIRAVLFDMDGTLLDTEPLYRELWKRAIEELGWTVDYDQFFKRVSGMNMQDMRRACLEMYGESFPFEKIREVRRHYLTEWWKSNIPATKAGIPHILPILKKMGLRLAVATSSGEAYARGLLKQAEIDRYFDAYVTGDMVNKGKPDPEIFLRAAEALGVSPSECVVAEDSRNGVLAGAASGALTVMIPDLMPATEELIPLLWARLDSLESLPSLIKNYHLESENT